LSRSAVTTISPTSDRNATAMTKWNKTTNARWAVRFELNSLLARRHKNDCNSAAEMALRKNLRGGGNRCCPKSVRLRVRDRGVKPDHARNRVDGSHW